MRRQRPSALREIAGSKVVLSGSAQANDSFDVGENPYTTIVANSDAEKRAAEIDERADPHAARGLLAAASQPSPDADVKLPPNRLSEFLRKPPPEFRAVLFYGPDTGLVRERADRTTAAICPDLKDPFRIAELSTSALAADPARLSDEIGALSLVGGRRVIRIRDAGDGLTALFGTALSESKGDSMIVIEGGDLPSRSSLRKLCEAARDVAVGACYADGGRDIAEIVRETLRAHDVAASSEAVNYLVAHLGNDRLVTRSELEKLALYAGNGGRIELADALACVGDSTALSLDDVIFAAADGDAARLEGSLFRCLQEGQSAVGILRAVMRHFQRLHLAASRMASGVSRRRGVAGRPAADLLQAARALQGPAHGLAGPPRRRRTRFADPRRTQQQAGGASAGDHPARGALLDRPRRPSSGPVIGLAEAEANPRARG